MSKSIKNFSFSSLRGTTQELYLKQIFTTEAVSFEFQKEFVFSDRSFIVDFFLEQKILLECSHTKSFKYEVALRHKAIMLEAKTAFIKQFHTYPMWVLLESERPIGTLFYKTLQKLMPSVDEIFTSRNELLEYLQEYSIKKRNPSSVNPFSSAFLLLNSSKEPSFGRYCSTSFHNSSEKNSCPYIMSKNNHSRQLIHQPQNSPFSNCNCLCNIYSHKMKKNSVRNLRCSYYE